MKTIFRSAIIVAIATWAHAETFHYVDWTDAAPESGTASGFVGFGDMALVTVDFEVLNADGSPGSFLFAQTDSGGSYWNPADPYISDAVENAPPGSDILALVGGENQTYRITFSEPVEDPIMAVLSLGPGGIEYDFDRPFDIVSQGTGFWGGDDKSLTALPGDVLRGDEGHGTIAFSGTFDSLTWTVPEPETWHGVTMGIRTTQELAVGSGNNAVTPEPNGILLAFPALMLVGLTSRRRRKN